MAMRGGLFCTSVEKRSLSRQETFSSRQTSVTSSSDESDDDAWIRKSVAVKSKRTLEEQRRLEEDMFSPRFASCLPGYTASTKELANALANRPEQEVQGVDVSKFTHSHCVGPLFIPMLVMVPFHVLVQLGMLGLGTLFAGCGEGAISYRLWVWIPYAIYACIYIGMEILLVRQTSVCFYNIVGRWKLFGCQIPNAKLAFPCWFFVQIGTSFATLTAHASASLLAGAALSFDDAQETCDTRYVQDKWVMVFQGSCFKCIASWISIPGLCLLAWIFYMVHVVTSFLRCMPAPSVFKADEHRGPLEIHDVVELVKTPRVASVLGKKRPSGNRFGYDTIWCNETQTTGWAVNELAEGLGMGTLINMRMPYGFARTNITLEELDRARPRGVDDSDGQDSTGNLGDANGLLGNVKIDDRLKVNKVRQCFQDMSSVISSLFHRIFLVGLLASGLSLHIQLTLFGIQWSEEEDVKTSIWIKAYIGTFSTGLKSLSILVFSHNLLQCQQIINRLRKVYENIPLAKKLDENHREKYDSIDQMSKRLPRDVFALWVIVLVFLANTIFVILKFVMVHQCPDHAWNVAWHLMDGCVALNGARKL